MISCVSQLTFLCVGAHHLIPLRREWIIAELQRAAVDAGLPKSWWPASHIADGIALWLERKDTPQAVQLADLQERIHNALSGIGMDEVSARLKLEPPPLRVNLLRFAASPELALELDFFHSLGEHLDELIESGFHAFAFVNLEQTIDQLCPQTRRSIRWHQLHRETLAFLGHRAKRLAA